MSDVSAAVNQNETENESGKRSVKLTVKALQLQIISNQKERNSRLKKLHKLTKDVKQLMLLKGNVSEVQTKYEMCLKLCVEIEQFHEALKQKLPDDEMSKQNEWVENQMHNNKAIIQNVEKWLFENGDNDDDDAALNEVAPATTVVTDDISPGDSVSNVGGKSGSSTGRYSCRSSRSSISSACLKAEAEKAALIAKAAALKQKHELDAQEEQLRQKRELLELQSQIAVQTAKVNVYRGSDVESSQAHSDGMNSYLRSSKRKSSLRLSATEFVPQSSKPQFNHPPTGGSNAAVQTEVQPTYSNPQFNLPPTGGSNAAAITEAQPKYSNPQFNLPSIRGDKTVLSMGGRRKEIFSEYVVPKAHALNPQPSIPQICHETYHATHHTKEPIQHVDLMQTNVDQGNLLSIMKQQNDITALLVQQHSSLSLPPRDIPCFDGDPLEYSTFIRAFEHGVEGKACSSIDCLYFLEQYTKGQPRELVKSCQHMPPDRGYQRAKALLQERFGNEQKIATAYMEKALGWPSVKSEDIEALQAFALFLRVCCNAMENISYMSEMNMPSNMRAIVLKLPYKLREKWRSTAYELQEKHSRQARFSDIVNLIERQVSIASSPLFGNIQDTVTLTTKHKERNKVSRVCFKGKGSSFATSVAAVNCQPVTQKQNERNLTDKPNKVICLLCEDGHKLELCPKMEKKLHNEKINFLKEKGVCFGCLSVGHMSRDCHRRLSCKLCNLKHPTILHIHSKEKKTNSEDTQQEISGNSHKVSPKTCGHIGAGAQDSVLAIVPVQVKAKKGNQVLTTYAFLDPGSTATFCSERLMRELKVRGRSAKILLRTMNQEKFVDSHVISGLEIAALNGNTYFELPEVYTQCKMPVTRDNIPRQEELSAWPYLSSVEIPVIDADVELLIGTNVPKALEPWKVLHSDNEGPYAVKTLLGWVINGPVRGGNETEISCPTITANRITIAHIEELLVKQYNHDFNEKSADDKLEMSREDLNFMAIMNSSAELNSGHYCMRLPFREDNVVMPNNRHVVEQRALCLKRKLEKNATFKEEYVQFLGDVIDKGYAERVPEHQLKGKEGKVWYIPHHGVHHPKKGTLRVVFDCGASFKGISLNNQLLQGPDLTNSLLGVLIRFRQEPIAVMADIQAMYHQVKVAKQDADFLRFLWWPNGELTQHLTEYRMTVHLFGAISSPSCASFALRKTADDNREKFPAHVINTIKQNFYVDDCLKSMPSKAEAMVLVKDLTALCQLGGFQLLKWVSNSRSVLESIDVEKRAKEIKGLDFDRDDLPVERTLGLQWCAETDTFRFKMVVQERPFTRRGILSVVSSVYDPIGFLAPFTLPAKLMLQNLCRLSYSWDDLIPQQYQQQWVRWLEDLKGLSAFSVPRCIKPKDFGQLISVQLHHFSDACEDGYGTVSYLRFKNDQDKVHLAFILGKARVAPVKKVTIPRMELTAAVLAVRVDRMLKAELQLELESSIFWTDSTTVLKYIRNETKRFHTFVSNRISIIREATVVSQWRYVDTNQNPADEASRGLKAEELITCCRWIHGPDFLFKNESDWPINIVEPTSSFSCDDPEVKGQAVVNTVILKESQNAMTQLITNFSSWKRLKTSVAWFHRWRKVLQLLCHKRQEIQECVSGSGLDISEQKNKVEKEMQGFKATLGGQTLSLEDISTAESAIIQYCQMEKFSNEITALKSGISGVKKNSPIYKLDPVLENGLLRVGGRLSKAAMPDDIKHPVILAKDQHISTLILRHIHEQLGHCGRNHLLSRLRQQYWITSANSAARKIISSCVICRRYRGNLGEQKMANLPKERLQPDLPPFTNSGVDYFGPFEVKAGRSRIKRYGVIFTCMASRAVHLEMAYSLDTSSCIHALRRFISRRGQVSHIRSDNGTNFVGAERELRQALSALNHKQIQNALLQSGVKWTFNTPSASHHGGVWERIICMVRKVLNSVLHQQTTDDEGLQTLLCEVEAILNDRPLTKSSDDPNDLEPLTPNHIILLKGKPALPPGLFDTSDLYTRRRWRQVQFLADLFWHRWVREYIPLLQERQRWSKDKRSFVVGDIVLVADSTAPRGSWLLGKVLQTFPDTQGLVRSVKVLTKCNILERPITKICLLLEAD